MFCVCLSLWACFWNASLYLPKPNASESQKLQKNYELSKFQLSGTFGFQRSQKLKKKKGRAQVFERFTEMCISYPPFNFFPHRLNGTLVNMVKHIGLAVKDIVFWYREIFLSQVTITQFPTKKISSLCFYSQTNCAYINLQRKVNKISQKPLRNPCEVRCDLRLQSTALHSATPSMFIV